MNKFICSKDLYEHDWDCISKFMTPLDLKKTLACCSVRSKESLTRCRTTVMKNIFRPVWPTVLQMLKRGFTPKEVFTNYLIKKYND